MMKISAFYVVSICIIPVLLEVFVGMFFLIAFLSPHTPGTILSVHN